MAGDTVSNILSVHGVSKRFGGLFALDSCYMDVREGTIVGLIGPNGAGKSTLFDIISGFQSPDKGRVVFSGEDITGMPAHDIAALGLVRTFQIPRALTRMTVLENMMLGPSGQKGEKIWNALFRRRAVMSDEERSREKAQDLLELFDLVEMKDAFAGSLSGGQKKLLEMARALMADPKILLLDEPFAGVNPTLSARLIQRIKELKDGGLTILVIEHGIPYVMELSDRVYVLDKGTILTCGSPEDVISDRRVMDAYLGGDEC